MSAPEITQTYLYCFGPPPETMYFTSMPKVTSHNVLTNYETSDALGTSGLAYMWKNTGAQSITVEAKFVAYDSARRDVVKKVNWCMSLLYPIKSVREGNQIANHPPLVFLALGDWLNFLGVVMQASVVYGESYSLDDLSPMEATVTLTLEKVRRPLTTGNELFNLGFVDVTHDEIKNQDMWS